MKNIIFILSLVSIISCKKEKNQAVQNASSSDSLAVKTDSIQTKNDTIKSVDDIKKEYSEMNALLTSKKLDSTGFKYICEEGGREGEVFFYYQDKKLKAVKNFYSEYSHFSSVTEYYIDKENVYFIFKQDTSWNFDIEAPKKSEDVSETKDDITERRIYLLNNKPVQCLEKKYVIRSAGNNQDPGTIQNKEIKCNIDELMKTYQSIIKNKDKKGEINQCL
jgi:hypothetical protein